ncbi:hypothetical protein VTJ04DRAFT_9574 [Mycothermus thermophilus]|uniref:uncharacterized protein n=1 Tax=Humicola insolens TaxID=85995 RepID=UPI003742B63C
MPCGGQVTELGTSWRFDVLQVQPLDPRVMPSESLEGQPKLIESRRWQVANVPHQRCQDESKMDVNEPSIHQRQVYNTHQKGFSYLFASSLHQSETHPYHMVIMIQGM